MPRRHPSYYRVAGIDLERELQRLRALEVFAGGSLAASAPELRVRRASRRPNRLGFAVPGEYRLSVTDYPGIRPGDVLETLLHELVHLHVGRSPGAHAWHGPEFKRALARAMAEAYGITAAAALDAARRPTPPNWSGGGCWAERSSSCRSRAD